MNRSRRLLLPLVAAIVILATPFLPADSAPLPPKVPAVGEYRFNTNIHSAARVDVEVVLASTPFGQARLEELREKSWSCAHTGRLVYRCSMTTSAPPLAPHIAERAAQNLSGTRLTFGSIPTRIELMHESEAYREWRVWASLSFNGREFSYYRILELPGLTKLTVGDSEESAPWFRLLTAEGERPETLALWQELTEQGSAGFSIHYFEGELTRETVR